MIRVTVEIIPKGDESKKDTIGIMEISNDLSHANNEFGNYDVLIKTADYVRSDIRVENFPKKGLKFWALIAKSLKNAFGGIA